MITILKETPITIKGQDCILQLVSDNAIWVEDACEYCYYRDWADWSDCCAPCCIVHGCHSSEPTYFRLIR